ncbi:terminase small subunit [Pseudomonas oryzihabitans]|uniref:Terminase small subunit n=1 Tax=Pseudomonas oryzihabitans TaxID=47885 RepID=A0ABX3IXG8_9PSED|nr:terminase small subunit [Pseudomonas psychrotolerans]ONN71719.1 hypothetical protein BVL52_08740 [Pseudomonas psychrotolerans]
MALTAKQQRFVDEYLVDLNATQAAIRTGYSPKTAEQQASRLLSNVKVREYLAQKQQSRQQRTEITQDYVLKTIVEVVERCRQHEPVLDRSGKQVYVDTPDGDQAPAYTFDAKNVLKGLELLGKHLRLFGDKDEHDAELKRLEIAKRRAELKRLEEGEGEGEPAQRIEVVVRDARKPDANA